jgi:hypothetical protein
MSGLNMCYNGIIVATSTCCFFHDHYAVCCKDLTYNIQDKNCLCLSSELSAHICLLHVLLSLLLQQQLASPADSHASVVSIGSICTPASVLTAANVSARRLDFAGEQRVVVRLQQNKEQQQQQRLVQHAAFKVLYFQGCSSCRTAFISSSVYTKSGMQPPF